MTAVFQHFILVCRIILYLCTLQKAVQCDDTLAEKQRLLGIEINKEAL